MFWEIWEDLKIGTTCSHFPFKWNLQSLTTFRFRIGCSFNLLTPSFLFCSARFRFLASCKNQIWLRQNNFNMQKHNNMNCKWRRNNISTDWYNVWCHKLNYMILCNLHKSNPTMGHKQHAMNPFTSIWTHASYIFFGFSFFSWRVPFFLVTNFSIL